MQKINKSLIDVFLDKRNVFSVIGVSKDSKKYGYKIYFDLKNVGYNVYSVNPNINKILDDKCHPNLRNLPTLPDLMDIVAFPKITKENVKECKNLGINKCMDVARF